MSLLGAVRWMVLLRPPASKSIPCATPASPEFWCAPSSAHGSAGLERAHAGAAIPCSTTTQQQRGHSPWRRAAPVRPCPVAIAILTLRRLPGPPARPGSTLTVKRTVTCAANLLPPGLSASEGRKLTASESRKAYGREKQRCAGGGGRGRGNPPDSPSPQYFSALFIAFQRAGASRGRSPGVQAALLWRYWQRPRWPLEKDAPCRDPSGRLGLNVPA